MKKIAENFKECIENQGEAVSLRWEFAINVLNELKRLESERDELKSKIAKLEAQEPAIEYFMDGGFPNARFNGYQPKPGDNLYLQPIANNSERITEQDAREMAEWILANHTDYDTSGSRAHDGRIFCLDCVTYERDGEIKHAEKCIVGKCSALLAKLNEHREPVTPNKAEAPDFSFKVSSSINESGEYWTANLIGVDSKELNIAAAGRTERESILAVLDLYVCAKG